MGELLVISVICALHQMCVKGNSCRFQQRRKPAKLKRKTGSAKLGIKRETRCDRFGGQIITQGLAPNFRSAFEAKGIARHAVCIRAHVERDFMWQQRFPQFFIVCWKNGLENAIQSFRDHSMCGTFGQSSFWQAERQQRRRGGRYAKVVTNGITSCGASPFHVRYVQRTS
jgi:hypothetical protein